MKRLGVGISNQLLFFGLSLLLHVGVVGLGLIQWSFSKPLHVRLDQPLVYQVDLVTLAPSAPGRPLPAQKAVPATPAAPAQAKPVPAPAPQPKAEVNIPEQAKKPPAPQPKAEVKKPEQPKKAPAPVKPASDPKKQPDKSPPKKAEPTSEQILAEALGAVQKDVAQRSKQDEREQALASLRQGQASGTGVAAGGLVEVYAQMVESRVKAHWRFLLVGSQPDLSATLEIQLSADGRIVGSNVVRSSGRSDFDASTERAVEEAGQLPPPPRPDLRVLRITFNLQEL